MHKKIYLGSLIIAVGIIGIWQLANAATTWQGPPTGCTYPGQTDCNTDGVVWNRANPEDVNVPANTGGFKVQGKAIINSDVKGYGDFYIPDTKSIRVDKAGDSIIKIGNWGGTGQWRSDLVIYGDLKVEQKDNMSVPQLHTPWLCLGNPGSEDCRNVWPSGGGGGSGTVTSISSGNGLTGGPITTAGTLAVMACTNGQVLKTNASNQWYCGTDNDTNSGGTISTINNGSGITITNGSGPTATVSADYTTFDGRYVDVAGDTMTGTLTLDTTGYPYALTVNGGNGGTAAVYGNNVAARGYGGQFYGAYGVYASTPNNANGFYAGYFDGYSGGVNAIGNMAGGVGILGQNAGTGSYGVEGYAVNGYGGHFMDSTYYSYVGGQGYGLLSNGKVQTSADVQGGRLCIGTDCRAAWPTAGTGDMTGVTAGNGLTGGGLSGDVTVNVGAGNGVSVAADTVSVMSCTNGQVLKTNASNLWYCGTDTNSGGDITAVTAGNGLTGGGLSGDVTLGLATCANGYIYKSNGTSMICQLDANSGGDITGVTAGTNMTGGGTTGAVTLNVTDNWVNYSGDSMTGNLTSSGVFSSTKAFMLNNDTDSYFSNGTLTGFARYGMIYESNVLSMAIPDGGVNNNEFQVRKYYPTGISTILLALRSDNGNFYVPVGNMYTKGVLVTSDVRLKKDISQLSKGLESVMSLIPVSYKFKTQKDDEQKNFGFIAQQVDTVLPDLVRLDSETGYYHISYEGVIPVTVKAIQEQQAEIEDLKAKNQELEARLERLEALIK